MLDKNRIHVFFACDDNFVKFTIVAIQSLKENADKSKKYHLHVLYTNMSDKMIKQTLLLQDKNFKISFDDVTPFLKKINSKLHTRDYYSKTTYYRIFIPEMFPELDKALYVDSDTIILGDISELYDYDLGQNYVGACNEQAMVQNDVFGTYVEKCVGIDRNNFFNAGILLINCEQFRKNKLLLQFINLLTEYKFIVTQDEDYLNVICKDKVLWIENNWNVEMFGEIKYEPKDFKLIHYIMVSKPWHYKDCMHQEFFWKYAEKTCVYEEIKSILDNYSEEEKQRDSDGAERLVQIAFIETTRVDNYLNRQLAKRITEL